MIFECKKIFTFVCTCTHMKLFAKSGHTNGICLYCSKTTIIFVTFPVYR